MSLTKQNYRWTAGALEALHEAAEHFLITLLENANMCAIHAKCVTVSQKDIELVIKLLDLKKNFKMNDSVTQVLTQSEMDEIRKEDQKRRSEIEDRRKEKERDDEKIYSNK